MADSFWLLEHLKRLLKTNVYYGRKIHCCIHSRWFLYITNQADIVKTIQNDTFDDFADAFMQIMAFVLR